MAGPLWVEVIAYAPTAFYHCTHCEVAWREAGMTNRIHQEQVENSLPADLRLEYQLISDWVREIFHRHGDQIVVKIIDAASPEGLIKTLRYGLHGYPAIIINRKRRFSGEMLEAAGEEITRLLKATSTEPV